MKPNTKIKIIAVVATALIGLFSLFSSTNGAMDLWKYTSGKLSPVVGTWDVNIGSASYYGDGSHLTGIGGMVYPGAGIPLSTGPAWGTSITDNSANWNTAYGWGNHASSGYLTGITSGQVTGALGFTPIVGDSVPSYETDQIFSTWLSSPPYVPYTGATSDVNLGTHNFLTTGTLGAGAITGTSFTIGANTLNTTEWAFLDGQDQSVFKASSPTFANLTIASTIQVDQFSAYPTTAARNNFTGTAGFRFSVSSAIVVNQLGRLYVAGNTQDHVVKLWSTASTTVPITTATILASADSDANGFKWVAITPVTLIPGVYYSIAIDETNGGDTWKDDWIPTFQSTFNTKWTCYSATPGTFPSNIGTYNHIYNTPALKYNAVDTITGNNATITSLTNNLIYMGPTGLLRLAGYEGATAGGYSGINFVASATQGNTLNVESSGSKFSLTAYGGNGYFQAGTAAGAAGRMLFTGISSITATGTLFCSSNNVFVDSLNGGNAVPAVDSTKLLNVLHWVSGSTFTSWLSVQSDGEIRIPVDMTAGAAGQMTFGAGQDALIGFTGSQLQIQSDLITATDSLLLRGGTNGILFNIGATQQLAITSLTGTFVDAFNLVFGTTTGTQIGTGATQKLSFYGKTPIVQATALTAVDASAVNSGDATTDAVINNMRTRINELETKLSAYGLLP